MLIGPLAVGDEEFHLVTRSKVRELTATSERVHVKEDVFLSPSVALVLIENEPIL